MLSYLLDFLSCLIKRPDSHRNVPLVDLQTADEGGKSFLHVLILLLQYDKGEVVDVVTVKPSLTLHLLHQVHL